jgi:hypothetical protein
MTKIPSLIEVIAIDLNEIANRVKVDESALPFQAIVMDGLTNIKRTEVTGIRREGGKAVFVTKDGLYGAAIPADPESERAIRQYAAEILKLATTPMSKKQERELTPPPAPFLTVLMAGELPGMEPEFSAGRASMTRRRQVELDLDLSLCAALDQYFPDNYLALIGTRNDLESAWVRMKPALDVNVDKPNEQQARALQRFVELELHSRINGFTEVLNDKADWFTEQGVRTMRPLFAMGRKQAVHLKAQSQRILRHIQAFVVQNRELVDRELEKALSMTVPGLSSCAEGLLDLYASSDAKHKHLCALVEAAPQPERGRLLVETLGSIASRGSNSGRSAVL